MTGVELSEIETLDGVEKTERLLLHLVRASASTVGDYTVHRLSREHLEFLGYSAGSGKRGAPPPVRRQGAGRGVIDLMARKEQREFYANEEEED